MLGRGYVLAFVAAVLYGVQYTPVKAYPIYDGSKFQWFAACGIAFSGLVGALLLSPTPLVLVVYGIMGGVLWGTSNVLVLPTVKFLGLGVGFAMYHSVNMAVGYAIGRFGLMGAPKETAAWPFVRDSGLALLIVSLVFMIFVDPEVVDVEDDIEARRVDLARMDRQLKSLKRPKNPPSKVDDVQRTLSVGQLDELSINAGSNPARRGYMNWRRGLAKGSVERSGGVVGSLAHKTRDHVVERISYDHILWPLFHAGAGATLWSRYRHIISSAAGGSAPPSLLVAATTDDERARLVDNANHATQTPVSDKQKRRRFALGTGCGIGAGILCGTNMLPYVLYLADKRAKGVDPDTLSFFFSQCLGVFLIATVLLALIAAAAKAARIELKTPAVWPAFASGVLWSGGFINASIAVADLGMAQAYTYDAIGPVMLSAIISFFCGEIVGPKNIALFLAALSLQAAGVVCIALGA